MDKLWAIVTPSKQLVFTSNEYHQLKLVQLLVSKSVFLDVVEWGHSKPTTIDNDNLEWHKKIKYVWDVLQTEQLHSEKVIESRSKTQIKAMLLAVQDFNSLIYPNNPQFSNMINLELEEIDRYKNALKIYKSFVFRTLYDVDFRLSVGQINSKVKRGLESPPTDDYLVCHELNDMMLNALNQDD